MIEEEDLHKIDFNNYLRNNIQKYLLAFSMFYGEEAANELKSKLDNSIVIGYQEFSDFKRLITNLEHKYTDKFISSSIEEKNIDKEYYFSNNPSFENFMPIQKFINYYELEVLGIDKRKEIFLEEGYNFLSRFNINISFDEYKEYVLRGNFPEDILNKFNGYIKDNIMYYLDISNYEDKYNKAKKNFYKEFQISNDIDFMNSDKLNEFLLAYECYKSALEKYNIFSKKISEYKEYIKKVEELKNNLEKKYYKEYISKCSFLFNEKELEEINKYLNKESYISPECLKILSQYSFKTEPIISSFSSEIQQKLDDENTPSWIKETIKENRIKYFKSKGIDLGNNYDNYINNENIKKIWPSSLIVSELEDIRLSCLNEYNIEFYTSMEEHKKFREEIDSKELLDKDDTIDASLYIKKGTHVSPNFRKKEDKYELFPIIAINYDDYFLSYLDHNIIHELNHLYELIINRVTSNSVEYLCGWDYLEGNLEEENPDTINIDREKRKYELFNEAINELITQEICEIIKDNNLEVFNNKDNFKYKGSSSYERSFIFVRKFYQEFKDDIILSRKNGNIEILFNSVGKENFNELNNLIISFNEYFSEMKYYKLLDNIKNNIENENTIKYNEFISKRDEILDKMRNYKNNNFSK